MLTSTSDYERLKDLERLHENAFRFAFTDNQRMIVCIVKNICATAIYIAKLFAK